MDEKESKNEVISFIGQKKILINLCIFVALFVLFLLERWESITLAVFPIITFSSFIIFTYLEHFSGKNIIPQAILEIQPFGKLKQTQHIFALTSHIQLLIIIFLGLDSNIHPQLMEDYFIFYGIPLFLLFSGAWYTVSLRIWSTSGIYLRIQQKNRTSIPSELENSQQTKLEPMIIFNQKYSTLRKLSILGIILFLITLSLTFLHFFLIRQGYTTFFTYNLYLPGDNLGEPVIISISIMIWFLAIIFPLFNLGLIYQNLRALQQIPLNTLAKIKQKFPSINSEKIKETHLILKYFKSN